MSYNCISRPNSRRRGAAVVLVAAMSTVIIAFAALTVDVGLMYSVKTDLQRAVDSSALAGAEILRSGNPDATERMNNSRAVALAFLLKNPILKDHEANVDSMTDIEFGQARLEEDGISVAFTAGVFPANAIRVRARYEPSFAFAQVLGLSPPVIVASATAGLKPRDYMFVIDTSGSMTEQSNDCDVAADLDDLGIANWRFAMGCFSGTGCCNAADYAVDMTYDGMDPEFVDVYDPGDRFLPPSVRIKPLKPTKDAAAYSVQVIQDNGYDDQLGVVAYATNVAWTEQLSTDYSRIHAKIRGIQMSMPKGTNLHEGINAARAELESSRARPEASKVMVLMTDGNSDTTLAMQQAQIAVDAGITIHCIGLGADVDHSLLDNIAALSNGVAMYINNVSDESVYGPQLTAVFANMASQRVGVGLIQ